MDEKKWMKNWMILTIFLFYEKLEIRTIIRFYKKIEMLFLLKAI